MKLGSLFDGSGGFPLAGALCGITPVWASEVEPYPIAVTRSRFPSMRHLGDVSKVSGADIEPVDIITFGSPCQDLSVAGKRAGLKHTENGDEETTRSGLFMEAVRIIKEMREKSGGKYPTFAVWENVPGAFSSNKGEDFKTVLEELIRVAEPEAPPLPAPGKNGWPYADCIVGDGWSLAWRVFDAQYWGVPQRRRRIYLVADFGGNRAGKILFEREGLRGYFEEDRSPWQGTPAHAGGSPETADRESELILSSAGFKAGQSKAGGIGWQEECAATLSAQCSGTEPTVCVCYPINDKATRYKGGGSTRNHDGSGNGLGIGADGDPSPTLTAGDRHAVCYAIENHPADSGVNIDYSGKVQTLTSRMGTGGGNMPMVMMPTIAYSIGNGQLNSLRMEEIAKPLDCMHDAQAVVTECLTPWDNQARRVYDADGVFPALAAREKAGQNQQAVLVRYIVRRLTPTECARLQGFADRWGVPDHKDDFSGAECGFWQEVRDTYARINGKSQKQYTKTQLLKWYNGLHTDSAEYKMWGNGIALPTALYVMQGIKEQEE